MTVPRLEAPCKANCFFPKWRLNLGESAINTNQRFCSFPSQRLTPRRTGAQGARTSRWPADTWSWHSPPSSACTSGGQHRHSDYGAFPGTFPDTADNRNQVWYNLKSQVGESNQRCLMRWDFSFFCFSVNFIVM